VLIFQFPLWWFGLPGILKGWVVRVFARGIVYGGGRWYDNGALGGRRAMLSLTTGGPRSIYSPTGLSGDSDTLLYPINHGIFRFVGFDVLPPFVAWGPARVGEERRRAYLDAYRARRRPSRADPCDRSERQIRRLLGSKEKMDQKCIKRK
jgi:NAD(P)H dehydrogenase (quinone)